MGFPFEIITMLASTVLGGLMSVWAESRKAKAEAQKLLIARGEFEMKARKQSIEAGQADKVCSATKGTFIKKSEIKSIYKDWMQLFHETLPLPNIYLPRKILFKIKLRNIFYNNFKYQIKKVLNNLKIINK